MFFNRNENKIHFCSLHILILICKLPFYKKKKTTKHFNYSYVYGVFFKSDTTFIY